MGMDNNLTARKGEHWIHLADWRKHYELDSFIGDHHDVTESHYVDDMDSWNDASIHLTLENVNEIISAYENGQLETGWGNSKGTGIENDVDVFFWAKELIEQGYKIWYSASY